jgi:hypothetical protein
MAMPVGSAILESGILPPLSYYKLTVPVTPLPRALNDEAMRDGSRFLQQAAQRHQRFLAMAFVQSYDTLDWLAKTAAGTYDVHELGQFDGVKVLEFEPHTQAKLAQYPSFERIKPAQKQKLATLVKDASHPSKVNSFLFNDEGAALYHRVDRSDVFANHAQGYELDRTEEE